MTSFGVNVGVEERRSLFRIKETTRKNSDLLERAAAYTALWSELADNEGIPALQSAKMIRSRLSIVDGLDDFMRLAGVVEECVMCTPPVKGGGMQLQKLGNDCWRLVRRYLSFDDVKCSTVAKAYRSTSS
ncbi:hypothetical protein MTO96_034506 [Rhipicephalus appendiculatus]